MISLTQDQQLGLNAICTDVQSILDQKTFSIPSIERYDRLVEKPDFWVGRLIFNQTDSQNVNCPASVILKHTPPESYAVVTPLVCASLQEEVLAYRFLTSLGPEFDRFPHLLGEKTGLLVLEDLNESELQNRLPVTLNTHYLRQVADTLARLHVYSASQRFHYDRLRSGIGLSVYSGVSYPCSDEWFGFLDGLKIWQSWADFFDLPKFGWHELVKNTRGAIYLPSPFLTFIHTELASPRNAVNCQRGLCLIDFERSRFGHALLDIAITMIGQIHWHNKEKGYFLRHLGADMNFANCYRSRWDELGGKTLTDHDWQMALSYALIFIAGLATAAAQRAEHRYNAVQPLSQVIPTIMKRLCENLSTLGCFSALENTLNSIAVEF